MLQILSCLVSPADAGNNWLIAYIKACQLHSDQYSSRLSVQTLCLPAETVMIQKNGRQSGNSPAALKIQPGWSQLSVFYNCLLYTSDAADERSSVDLGGRRIIKKPIHKSIEGVKILPYQ